MDTCHPQTALKYETEVHEQGRVEITVPYAPGDRVVLFVMPALPEGTDDLLAAAQTSLDFWDNPYDDQDWNQA